MINMKSKRKIIDIYGIYAIIIGVTTSIEALIFASDPLGGDKMNSGVIGIIIALIGVIGSVLLAVFQAKKHGDKIDDTKSDTQAMRPKIDNIDKSTEKIRDNVIETLVPQINNLSKASEKIDLIEKEVSYRQRLKSDVSLDLTKEEHLIGGIEKLYERNGALENENRELKRQLSDAQRENKLLRQKNQDLLLTNKELAKDIERFSQNEVEIKRGDLEL